MLLYYSVSVINNHIHVSHFFRRVVLELDPTFVEKKKKKVGNLKHGTIVFQSHGEKVSGLKEHLMCHYRQT